MEIKTNASLQRHEGGSIDSVSEVMDRYRYQYGVLLDLAVVDGIPQPAWHWIKAHTSTSDEAWPLAADSNLIVHVDELRRLAASGRELELSRYS